MLELKTIKQEMEVIDYSTHLEEICRNNSCYGCRFCLPDENIVRKMDRTDNYGCVNTNYLIRLAEDYQHRTKNEAIDGTLIGLTISSKVQGILTKDEFYKRGIPDKEGILDGIKQLNNILNSENFEEKDSEIETLSSTKPNYLNILKISRKILPRDLF